MWLLSNKVLVKDSGLFEGFCEYHCHLLPEVDDGVQEKEETFKILNHWEQVGVKEVWLTPHIMEDMPNKTNDLRKLYDDVKSEYAGNIQLQLASENMMDNLLLQRLEQNDVLPIGKEGKYLLVETSYYNPPMNMKQFFERIRKSGYIVILAHPERYQYMDEKQYDLWKTEGVLMQLNVPSLIGAYGVEVQKKAEMLLDKGMYDFCGTDTHSMGFVEFFMNTKISKKIVRKIQHIVTTNTL